MFEAYKIAVTVGLVNHASTGLLLLSRDFLKTEKDAERFEKRLKSIKGQALKGALLTGAGLGLVGLFKAPLDEAMKFEQETARFASLGFGDATTAQAVKFARGMQTIGTSARDNMTLLTDAMAVFKDMHHAEFAAPLMAKMKFANEALFGQQGGEHATKFMDMLKVIEFRGGLSSQEEFAAQANFAQRAITGSRNRVDATQMLNALKTGGVALSRRSNEGFYLGAEPLIQEFGGMRYGTGAMSIYQNLVQSRGSMTSQQELYRLGLLDKSKVEFNSEGRLKKALAGAFVGSSVLEHEGELALLEKVLLPAFEKAGIRGEESQIRELGLILGNRTGSGLMSRILQQRKQLHVMTEANAHAEDIDQLSARAGKSGVGKFQDLHKKWRDVLLELGNTVLPVAIEGTTTLIGVLKPLARWMSENTGAVKALTWALIGLSGALMVGGVVNLLRSAASAFRLIGGSLGWLGRFGAGAAALGLGGAASAVAVAGYAFAGYQGVRLGSALYDWYQASHREGVTLSADAKARLAARDAPKPDTVRPNAGGGRGFVNQINLLLDGKTVTSVVVDHMGRTVNRPDGGTAGLDPQVGMPKPAGGYTR